MPIHGHSVFSQAVMIDSTYRYKMRGGLSGLSVDSIEEVDDAVQGVALEPHDEWVDAYLQKKARRDKDD